MLSMESNHFAVMKAVHQAVTGEQYDSAVNYIECDVETITQNQLV